MPIQSIVCDPTGTLIHVDANKYLWIPNSSLIGDTPEQKEQDLVARLQSFFDTEIRLNTLPQDDPDRAADPARPELFWSDDNKYLISRAVTVTGAPWNPDLERFEVQLQRSRGMN